MCGTKGAGEKTKMKHNEKVLECAKKAQHDMIDQMNKSLVAQRGFLEETASRLKK